MSDRVINAYWACKDIGNFGDVITPYIIEKITGISPEHSTTDGEHFFLSGSILNLTGNDTVVMGSGFGSRAHKLGGNPRVVFVRGPYSARIIKEKHDRTVSYLYDPGLVLREIYTPKSSPRNPIGVIPHYVDHDRATKLVRKTAKIINILDPIESVIDEIASCELIFSSSLHGVIAAHSYGIPAIWVQFSDGLAGDGVKFYDYFSSVNILPYAPLNFREDVDFNINYREVPKYINTRALIRELEKELI